MTDDELIADFLRRRGVTRCASAMPRPAYQTSDDADEALLEHLQGRIDALLNEAPDAPREDADWWAAYEIGAADPWRDIAEAAALLVIARDEGIASYRLFEKELCR